MKQEQIEKAAREFTDNLIAENHFDVNYEEDNYDAGSIHATDEVGVYAFTRGAEWRITLCGTMQAKSRIRISLYYLNAEKHTGMGIL